MERQAHPEIWRTKTCLHEAEAFQPYVNDNSDELLEVECGLVWEWQHPGGHRLRGNPTFLWAFQKLHHIVSMMIQKISFCVWHKRKDNHWKTCPELFLQHNSETLRPVEGRNSAPSTLFSFPHSPRRDGSEYKLTQSIENRKGTGDTTDTKGSRKQGEASPLDK
jgi:hypothetical protein